MRSFSAGTIASLESGEIIMRGMVLFDFPSGNYGFWDGGEPFEYNGVTYRSGALLKLEDIEMTAGLEAAGMSIRLTAVPDQGIDNDALATIESEQYVGRPVTLFMAYFAPNGELLSVERIWRGYVDGFDHIDEPGKEAKLVCRLEGKGLDNVKKGTRIRGHADQARISRGDRFFEHVATTAQLEVNWGRQPQKAA